MTVKKRAEFVKEGYDDVVRTVHAAVKHFEVMEKDNECFTLGLQRLPEQSLHRPIGACRYLCMPQRSRTAAEDRHGVFIDAIALSRLYKHDFRGDIAVRPKHAGIIA